MILVVAIEASASTSASPPPLRLSAELRARVEAIGAQDFGVAGGQEYIASAYRLLVSADARPARGGRLFAQLSTAEQTGREPRPRPFDESAPDIAQLFLEMPVHVGRTSATIRAGRQELALGNRLVALRDGVTLRRAFDGVRADVTMKSITATAFLLSPVQNASNAFDDRRTPGERFRGATVSGGPKNGRWTVFALERRRRVARYAVVGGPERRQTWGLAYSTSGARFDLVAQAALQRGRTGDIPVRAWGAVIDGGWQLRPDLRLGAALGYASGDRRPGTGRLRTFDPLYPNLGSFTDAPLSYYSNQIDAQVSATRETAAFTMRAEATLLARAARQDAIYAAPGRPLAVSPGSRLSAIAFEGSVRWRPRKGVELMGSMLRAVALDGIKRAGGRDTNFGLIQLTTTI
jgi:hypothetical protein